MPRDDLANLRDEFGLGAGYEHPRPDLEGEPAEVRTTGEVLQWNPRGALLNQRGEPLAEGGLGWLAQDHGAADLGVLDPKQICRERDCVDLW